MWKILAILLCLTALILLVVMICDSNRFVKFPIEFQIGG